MLTFPATLKTTDILDVEDLVTEIKKGNLIEASMPNGVLKISDNGNFLIFDGLTTTGEWNKRAVHIASKNEQELKVWIENLIPVESEEDREDRLRTEYAMEKYYEEKENDLRAASFEEDWDVEAGLEEVLDNIPDCAYYDEDAAFNQFYFG